MNFGYRGSCFPSIYVYTDWSCVLISPDLLMTLYTNRACRYVSSVDAGFVHGIISSMTMSTSDWCTEICSVQYILLVVFNKIVCFGVGGEARRGAGQH